LANAFLCCAAVGRDAERNSEARRKRGDLIKGWVRCPDGAMKRYSVLGLRRGRLFRFLYRYVANPSLAPRSSATI
jgi:hypothetical protein